MEPNADLDRALSFVIGRTAEQAKLSGEPLNDDQRLLLNYLPTSSSQSWDPEIPELVPRNVDLERVCALAKAAYQHDRQSNPTSLDWEFALAVFTLYRHPMGGLLQWVGMKRRRPRWDSLSLLVTASLPAAAAVLLAWNVGKSSFRSMIIGSGCVAIMLLMFFVSRRRQEQQLEEEIERYRVASRFAGTVAR